jgi:hypothetical protein
MQSAHQSSDETLLSEAEAAERLGVSIKQLHRTLDKNVFTGREPRPANCTFRASDLVLLGFWLKNNSSSKVLCMPSRK